MERKLDKLLNLMQLKEWEKALSLAAKWHDLGDEKDAIKSADAAVKHKEFYKQLGKDIDIEFNNGIKALCRRYGHHLAS